MNCEFGRSSLRLMALGVAIFGSAFVVNRALAQLKTAVVVQSSFDPFNPKLAPSPAPTAVPTPGPMPQPLPDSGDEIALRPPVRDPFRPPIRSPFRP